MFWSTFTTPRASIATTLTLIMIAGLMPRTAEACMSTPPPRCARTLVIAAGGPPMVIAPAGGAVNFDLPAIVFFRLLEAPPGACPPANTAGPETATLSVTVDAVCTEGTGSGTLGPMTINGGYTELVIPISLAPGGARICTLTTTATAALPDGSSLTASSGGNVCVGESAPPPVDPNLPRLDIRRINGSGINRVHPGDQTSTQYEITNNDPNESYSGKLAVSLINVSRNPDFVADMPTPVDGSYSVSDPVQGDNFPLGFTEDLVNGCLYIPKDHTDPAPSSLNKFIDLAPGESTVIEIFSRPFAQCGNGSCASTVAILDGVFSDTSQGLACAGFVVATDTSVAPEFAWAQGGAAGIMQTPPADFVMEFFVQPQQFQTLAMFMVRGNESLLIDAALANSQPAPTAFAPGDDLGRFVATAGQPGTPLLPDGNTYTFANLFEFSPGAPLIVEVLDVQPATPTGFENIGPGAIVTAGLRELTNNTYDTFVDVRFQVSGDARFSDGSFQRLQIDQLTAQAGPFPPSINVIASGPVPQPVGTEVLEQITIYQDILPFGRPNSDFDQDTVTDDLDNCTLDINTNQRDTDGDDIGNTCDADVAAPNNCIVNFSDLNLYRAQFFQTGDFDTDNNGDGVVNFTDLNVIRRQFFGSPGPSANGCN